MKITVLAENTSNRDDLIAEHGLSLYIETEEYKILFDMGQTTAFLKNAKKLGIDISDVDFAVISHGHYDHGGGLSEFININKKAPVYVNKDAFLPHYNGTEKYIGLDMELSDNKRLIFTGDRFKISDSINLLTCNGMTRKHTPSDFYKGLLEKKNYGFAEDDFRHEQYLEIYENGKRILISGCSHKGILDISEWTKPDIIVGGFHFSKIPLGGVLERACLLLENTGIYYYTCHCTGTEQFEFMKKRMSRLQYISCGTTLLL